MAWTGETKYGQAMHGAVWQGMARFGSAWLGLAGHGRDQLAGAALVIAPHLFERMLMKLGVIHRCTWPYSPQASGKMERFGYVLEQDPLDSRVKHRPLNNPSIVPKMKCSNCHSERSVALLAEALDSSLRSE